jgi:hypothetical protein
VATKQLSDEHLADSILQMVLTSHRGACAFVPVTNKESITPAWCLGIAVSGENGYREIPCEWVHADTYDEMCMEANRLNLEKLSLGDLAADAIIVSTMQGGITE